MANNFPLFILISLMTCSYIAWVSCKSLDLSSQIKSIDDNIIKSPNDKRLYRAIKLKNDMKILLISDPNTTQAAVDLNVNSGFINDPKDLPQLSHLLEHVLLSQGKDKEGQDNSSFVDFVKSHGGTDNAGTSVDSTNYHFEVLPAYLPEALNRFAKLFVAPKFSINNAESELSAVNSEIESTLMVDVWRLQNLFRILSDKSHAYHSSHAGNKEKIIHGVKARNSTLAEELIKLYNKYYSANRMTMAIIGNQTLDEMTTFIVPLFSQLVNKNLPKPVWSHPYGPKQLGFCIEIETIVDHDHLMIMFPIPDYSSYYRSKPEYYIKHLLTRKGKNSLLDQLKTSGLIVNLLAGTSRHARGINFFVIECLLTRKGLNETEKIIVHIMQYINRLKEEKPQEWIHRELEKMLQVDFRFMDPKNTVSYVAKLASVLQDVPVNESVYKSYIMNEYNPELIQKLLSHLEPYNMNVLVLSKSFKGKTDRTDKGYETKYKMSRINDYILKKMQQKNSKIIFTLPKPNIYLPEMFEILKSDDNDNSTVPKIIHETTQSRIWYLKDNTFLLPEVYLYFYLRNPIISTSVTNFVLSILTYTLINEDLSTKLDGTADAGLSMQFSALLGGYEISFSGYNDKMHEFATTIFNTLVSAKLNKKLFFTYKDLYMQGTKNIYKNMPHKLTGFYEDLLLLSKDWSQAEILAAANATTFQMAENFRQEFFSKLHIELFAYGNIKKEGAKRLLNDVLGIMRHQFTIRPLFMTETEIERNIMLPEGKKYLFTAETKTNKESAVRLVFETSVSSVSNNAMNSLIGYIIRQQCFDQLRTKEHLGYRASCRSSARSGVNTIEFVVQGDKDPKFVDLRIEALIVDLEKMLIEMPDEKFETYKSSLISVTLKKIESMAEMAKRNWGEIRDETFYFNRSIGKADAIRNISKDALIAYFREMLNADSPKRRKLAIYVYSSEQKHTTMNDSQDVKKAKMTKITNIQAFKNSLPFYGIPEPFMDIPPVGVDPLKDE